MAEEEAAYESEAFEDDAFEVGGLGFVTGKIRIYQAAVASPGFSGAATAIPRFYQAVVATPKLGEPI